MRDPATVAGRLEELQEAVDVSRSELRRFIYDLRPIKLQELGLVGAIEYWIHQVTTGKPVRCNINVTGTARRLRPATEAALYGVAKEAISNIMKHARASRFEVTIDYLADTVRLIVIDDGCGFDIESVRGDDGSEGIGLRSIGERMSKEGGTVDIRSVPQGGTRIEVTVRG
jgi:signal transduction histidine kinase